ncbi:glycosyltransferase family 2 protein [Pedobacter changchengzhani]|uniref:Glycosyltransferase family 2 protein n=1 Tax=Pedobacter changchengzhani TaxID=2529274 RepID=A0A4R5MLN5_9SPHI|nr:glycosyltransferase [Pedobacter changchengzhani]TDG36601.1 glycosyltransferase family 2 protein [Pedobacter changchengzhani]
MSYFVTFYQYAIYFYATAITIIYFTLAIFAYFNILKNKLKYTEKEERIFLKYPETAPGISVVAPAFNEEVIIIDSVNTLLGLNYPNFEIVIVNDGSKDSTLQLLIDNFQLEEVPFAYMEKVPCKPVKRILKSTNSEFSKLTVVDKINGGTKADAMNAGVNVAKFDYFINTDVDCILSPDTLSKIILPVLDSDIQVIGVGATMRMANGCDIDHGFISRVSPPKQIIPTFQETEYLRSYLVAKMGWASFNAVPNISGGFGLFDKSVVIAAGGFDSLSHAEDMDMTLRMIAYMRDNDKPYRILQIPHTLCWTEGPPNLKVLSRQRTRWGRGLMQIFFVHHKFLFNKKYGRMGWVIMPYTLFFELLAPIIETIGTFFTIYLLWSGEINFNTFWLMLSYVYLIGVSISILTITFDITIKKLYRNFREYLRLLLFSSVEAFFYHPFTVFFTLRGYFQFFTRKEFKWGAMTRQGFSKKPQSGIIVEKVA